MAPTALLSPICLANSIDHYYGDRKLKVADVNKIIYLYQLIQIDKGYEPQFQFVCEQQHVANMGMPVEASIHGKWSYCSVGIYTTHHYVLCAGEKRPYFYPKKNNLTLWDDIYQAMRFAELVPLSVFTDEYSAYAQVKQRGDNVLYLKEDFVIDMKRLNNQRFTMFPHMNS